MGRKVAAPDELVAALAAKQHGVVTTQQLKACGVSPDAIKRRQSGRLHRLHQGVYAVGHRGLSTEGEWMAAVLACCGYPGPVAGLVCLSHRSAAGLWQLLPVGRGPIDVAIVGETGRSSRAGLRVHRPRTLEPEMIVTVRGIPTTDPQRTLADLERAKPSRGGARADQLRDARRQAAVLGLTTARPRSERTRSELEEAFLRLCSRYGLPRPEVNVEIAGMEVDFLWRPTRLVVETDGYAFHRGRSAFNDDRRRDLRLRAAGFEVVRLSYSQVTNEAKVVGQSLRRLLRAAT